MFDSDNMKHGTPRSKCWLDDI